MGPRWPWPPGAPAGGGAGPAFVSEPASPPAHARRRQASSAGLLEVGGSGRSDNNTGWCRGRGRLTSERRRPTMPGSTRKFQETLAVAQVKLGRYIQWVGGCKIPGIETQEEF